MVELARFPSLKQLNFSPRISSAEAACLYSKQSGAHNLQCLEHFVHHLEITFIPTRERCETDDECVASITGGVIERSNVFDDRNHSRQTRFPVSTLQTATDVFTQKFYDARFASFFDIDDDSSTA